ncbi:hypothetical protein [uncultured Sulfitobacter sp.]|uniref:hypothetical protein n=1 Tax=Sulfitobacter sp. SH22 TaxID=3421172 RepID=UPI0025F24137|nr:hypothetical protein [uncultured Sulfitobacter sp.]
MLSVGLRRSHAPAAINPTTGSDIAVKLGFFVGKTGYFLSVETTNAGKHFQALMKVLLPANIVKGLGSRISGLLL